MEELAAYLQSHGIKPWVDRVIKPTMRWRDALLDELRACDKLVAILSPGYIRSEHCRMEVFIARSFGRPILPVMVSECFAELRKYEETKGLEDIFMMRMHKLSAVGLSITKEESFERILDALVGTDSIPAESTGMLYVSYARDGEFASALAAELNKIGVDTWIATRNVAVGENWRDAQVRAMMRASAHLVVLDENIVKQNVLRTEILLSEARQLPTLTVLPPRLNDQPDLILGMRNDLDRSDKTYRRLEAINWFSCTAELRDVAGEIAASLAVALTGRDDS
jgi:hypothetical protein